VRETIVLVALALAGVGGCTASSGWMRYSAPTEPPSESYSKVVFYRTPSYAGHDQHWDVWDGDELVGVSENGGYFEYLCCPGAHFFHLTGGLTLGEGTAVEADLAGGKTYFIRVKVGKGLVPAPADVPEEGGWRDDFGRCVCRELRRERLGNGALEPYRDRARARVAEWRANRVTPVTRVTSQQGE
jgi:hypothetical protein